MPRHVLEAIQALSPHKIRFPLTKPTLNLLMDTIHACGSRTVLYYPKTVPERYAFYGLFTRDIHPAVMRPIIHGSSSYVAQFIDPQREQRRRTTIGVLVHTPVMNFREHRMADQVLLWNVQVLRLSSPLMDSSEAPHASTEAMWGMAMSLVCSCITEQKSRTVVMTLPDIVRDADQMARMTTYLLHLIEQTSVIVYLVMDPSKPNTQSNEQVKDNTRDGILSLTGVWPEVLVKPGAGKDLLQWMPDVLSVTWAKPMAMVSSVGTPGSATIEFSDLLAWPCVNTNMVDNLNGMQCRPCESMNFPMNR